MTEPTTPATDQNSSTPSADTTPKVSVHRWPWRTEEFVSMAVAVLIVLGVGFLILKTTASTLSGAAALALIVVFALAALATPYYLYRVKKKRTDISQVTITIIGNVIRSESRGPLGKSQGDITKTKTVSYRKYNSDETFMIGDGDQSVRIPVRATSNRDVRDAVEAAFATADNVASEARDLLTRMPPVSN